jgi:hypothetical protein
MNSLIPWTAKSHAKYLSSFHFAKIEFLSIVWYGQVMCQESAELVLAEGEFVREITSIWFRRVESCHPSRGLHSD